ncbi:uncharacterized protein LOC134934229 [Pseudophryne corroboree]|uniref:uncharacterized protein LOC134934229 n=1 Tax=Pseudophryne corroboree TaxID=495146 RepID=UPI003081DEF6
MAAKASTTSILARRILRVKFLEGYTKGQYVDFNEQRVMFTFVAHFRQAAHMNCGTLPPGQRSSDFRQLTSETEHCCCGDAPKPPVPWLGFSQWVSGFKCCQKTAPWKESYFPFLVEKASYAVCRTNVFNFTLPRGNICLDQFLEKRVQDVISCIDRGRHVCLVKPPTSTVFSTRSAPNKDVSTQSRMVDSHTPTQTPVPDVPDSNPNDNKQLYGSAPSEGNNSAKKTLIILISVIGIVLGIAAVGTAVWCRMKRRKDNLPSEERFRGYSLAALNASTV